MKTRLSLTLLILLLLIPTIFQISNLAMEKSFAIVSIYTLFSALLLVLPLSFIRPALFGYISIPFLIIMPFELIHVINYDGYSTLAAFASTIESNPGEAGEFQHSYRHYFYVLFPLILVCIAATVFYIKRDYRLHLNIRVSIFVLFIATLSIFTAKTTYEQYIKGESHLGPGISNLYSRLFTQNYPFSYFSKGYKYIKQHNELIASLETKKDFVFGVTTDKQALLQNKPIIILVIGETARAHNWQLSGYHRQTNPNLKQRSNLLYYNNAISAATHTSQTIQLVLSRATPNNLEPIYSEKSIVTAFSEAGYKTIWISNQNMTGGVETSIYAIATESDERIFTGADYEVKSEMDEALIPILERSLQENKDTPLFIVIHTMGSHEVYRQRYPASFEKFKPSSRGDDYNFASPGIRERLLNSYDNSILYTDYILNRLIEVTSNENRMSTITYFSDHGENILDDNNRFGHGGVIPTQYVTDIPMFIWASEEFQTQHPEIYENLSINTTKPVSNLYLFDTLLDIGSIQIDGFVNQYSLANKNFTPSDRYILNTSYKPLKYTKIIFSAENSSTKR